MFKFSSFSVILFLFFSFIFYGIAIVIYSDFILVINCLFFILICSLIIIYFPPYPKKILNIKIINEDKVFNSILFLLGPLSLFLALIIFSPPIFSEDPELDRVIFADRLGFFNRINTATNYFFIIYNLLLLKLSSKNKLRIFLILFTVFLIFLTGFRSRLIDIFFISLMVFSYQNYFSSIKKLFSFRLILLASLFIFLIVYVTQSRSQLDIIPTVQLIIKRIFLINYEVNFNRILEYTLNNDFLYGNGYLNDFISVFNEKPSMQQLVTSYFNKANYQFFVMTPTQFGEAFLNFGNFTNIFYPFVLFFYLSFMKFTMKLVSQSNHKGLLIVFLIYSTYFLIRTSPTLGISSFIITKFIPAFILVIIFNFLIFISNKNEKYLYN